MKVILLGSTGMVGKSVLLECLEDPGVTTILAINRQNPGISNEKLSEIIHDNFYDFSNLKEQLIGFDACFFCIGVSSVGMNKEAYFKITHDLTIGFAQIMCELNPNSVFCYVTGTGTKSSEKGLMEWSRVKGRTENEILAMPFKDAYMFRPGYIHPLKGITSKTKSVNVFYALFKPFYYILKPFKAAVTDSVSLGKAMIMVVRKGYGKKIITNKDINSLAGNK